MEARGEDAGWRDEKLGNWGLRGASSPISGTERVGEGMGCWGLSGST